MKNRLIAAALAALFMLPILGLTAYAAELDDISDPAIVAEVADDPGEAPDIDPEETPGDEADPDDLAALLSLFMLMGMMGGNDAPAVSALPPGVASVIDYNTDPDGRLFYTIMTPDEHVFYLVIDKSSNTDNVYFLNAVTVADLLPLAAIPAPQPGGSVTPPPSTSGEPEQPTPTPPPAEQPQGGNMGMYIIVALLVIGGGGAGWYFKIYRPKQQGAGGGDEYDPTMNEAENDYIADWGEDEQDEETGDDSPPWDEDGESVDDE